MNRLTRIVLYCAAFVVAAGVSQAQVTLTDKSLSEELSGVEKNKNGDKVTLGEINSYFVDPQKAKAIVKSIDLEARTISVVPAKKNGSFRVAELTEDGRTWSTAKEMTLAFVTPEGLEKIIVSGQAAKSLGKKSLRLEELPEDATVKVEYYPGGPAAREVTVTSVPQG